MLYSDFQGKQVSQLGFGAMRLPLTADGVIDQDLVNAMVKRAFDGGVNYFDTAYPYHNGQSELSLGIALQQLPRESFYLATKYPGHQIADSATPELYDAEKVFEEQLRKCQVEYFDFYLLHNVYERSLPTYLDSQRGIVDFFVKQKEAGRIKHLGFSTHGHISVMQQFLDSFGDQMEFCQVQLNYLDWTLQDAKKRCKILEDAGVPIVIMEPVRGGALASLSESDEAALKQLRPDRSIASWAFAWLQDVPQITTLSGMSTMEQVEDNLASYEEGISLNQQERAALEKVAQGMLDILPCTACRYCCDSCPQELDIPMLLSFANDVRFKPSFNVGMTLDALPQGKRPEACTKCGACSHACPQGIDVPKALEEFAQAMKDVPHWADLIRSREQAISKL